MGLLDGKVVFVTGAGRCQGRAHALVSAREGADIIATDIAGHLDGLPYELATQADLDETVRLVEQLGRRAIGMVADVRSQTQLDQAVARGLEEFGRIDVLIANAGIVSLGKFWELSEAAWDDMIDIDLTGVWKSAKAVAPHMIERRTGSIVVTSSVLSGEPAVDYAHYCAAKAGATSLMKTMALELAPYDVRCNAVAPGAVRSRMTDYEANRDRMAGRDRASEEEMLAAGYHYHALPRTMLEPEVVAETALYLNSDGAANITGVEIAVDAGHRLLQGLNMNPTRRTHDGGAGRG
jgi:SDR family mycofactocin-dependent oxidoreductase